MTAKRVEENGFRHVELQHETVKTILYMKGALKLLQNQMRMTPASNILLAAHNKKQHDTTMGIISHPKNANIGRYR